MHCTILEPGRSTQISYHIQNLLIRDVLGIGKLFAVFVPLGTQLRAIRKG